MAELRWGSATHPGQLRPQNEDQYLAAPGLFVVADGMGGHQAGEIASRLAIERMQALLTDGTTMSDVVAAIGDANGDIFRAAIANSDQQGMGTTVTSLAVVSDPHDGEVFALANVGDSRTYLIRNGKLRQLTIDHSYVQELVAEGHINRDEARNHPRRNIVTRALGIEPAVRVDSWTLPIVRGDRYVLCSDGLVDEVIDDDIAIVLVETEDPQRAADELVRVANERGGHDNITVVVVDVLEGLDPPDPTEELDIIPAWAPPDMSSADVDVDTGEFEPVMIPPSPPAPADEEVTVAAPRKRNRFLVFLAVVGVAAVLVAAFTILAAWARDGYYVAFNADDQVVIYKGRPDSVLWFDPTVEAVTQFSRDELDDESIELVEEGQRFETQRNAAIFVEDRLETTTTTTTATTTTTTTTTSTTTTTVAGTTTSGP